MIDNRIWRCADQITHVAPAPPAFCKVIVAADACTSLSLVAETRRRENILKV
jgi:hypothetical protein